MRQENKIKYLKIKGYFKKIFILDGVKKEIKPSITHVKYLVKYLKVNKPCDMPDFFELLKNNNHFITAYPIHETWADVGRPIDLSEVNEDESGSD